MRVSLDKKYRTRDGQEAIIDRIDFTKDRDYPVTGSVNGIYRTWKLNGEYCSEKDGLDLIEIKPKKESKPKTRLVEIEGEIYEIELAYSCKRVRIYKQSKQK